MANENNDDEFGGFEVGRTPQSNSYMYKINIVLN